MKLALDYKSVATLREFADTIPKAMESITADTVKLATIYHSISDKLGSHSNDFYLLVLHIQKAQMLSVEALIALPPMMRRTADRVERYLNEKPQVLSGKTFGADGEEHDHITQVFVSAHPSVCKRARSFGSDSENAQTWGNNNYLHWKRRLTNLQRQAIYTYSGDEVYNKLNQSKRAGIPLSPEMSKIDTNIQESLQSTCLPESIMVYRAISENAMRELALYCSQGKIVAGSDIQENAFMSCSLICDNAFNSMPDNKYIFRLAATEGIHAAYIGNLSSHPYEQELLIDSGCYIHIMSITQCPRWEITGKTFDNDIVTVIDGVLSI